GGQGVVGSGLPIRIDDGNVGGSQVPWKPWWPLSVLFDPGRIRQAEWTKSKLPDTAPACVQDEGSKRLVFSGLNHTTFDLAVYASQDGSPHHHARLASGCWSSFARRDSYPQGFSERFQSSSLFLPSKAYLTQGHHTQFFGVRYGVPETTGEPLVVSGASWSVTFSRSLGAGEARKPSNGDCGDQSKAARRLRT